MGAMTHGHDPAALDRVHRLCVLLEAAVQEMAAARRQSARLRVENRRLGLRLAELQMGGSGQYLGLSAELVLTRTQTKG